METQINVEFLARKHSLVSEDMNYSTDRTASVSEQASDTGLQSNDRTQLYPKAGAGATAGADPLTAVA